MAEGPEATDVAADAVLAFDIGKFNLAYCLRTLDSVTPLAWSLVDLVNGKHVAFGTHNAAPADFQGTGKKPTIADCVAALWRHLDGVSTRMISLVVIETQLGQSNVGCKVLSHCIQYWAMTRGLRAEFRRPYAATLPDKPSYAKRKRIAVEHVRRALEETQAGADPPSMDPTPLAFFNAQAKKDDLADSWLLVGGDALLVGQGEEQKSQQKRDAPKAAAKRAPAATTSGQKKRARPSK